MLELRRLRLLRELEARGTVGAVGRALGYTPSAVSQGLAALEREAGAALLEPAGRGVRLTDAGRVLAGHAAILLDQLEAAEADLAASTNSVAGTVRVAAFQTALLQIVAPALEEVGAAHPGVRLEVVEAEVEQALPALATGALDLVIGDEYDGLPRPRPPGIDRERLLREQVRVILPAGHPAAAAPRVALGALARAAWASGQPGTAHREVLAHTCRALGNFEPDVRHRTNDLMTLLRLVRTSRAVTFLPDLVFAADPGTGLVARIPAEGEVGREVFLLARAASGGRPAVAAVRAALAAAAARAARAEPPG
jgi:DNA-binding transcriptional LysR family regulator